MNCYCRDCQRASGSGHLPTVGVKRAGFSLVGRPKIYAKRGGSGKQMQRHFCPICGSLVFGAPAAMPEVVTIYAGTLDEPSIFNPDHAQFTGSCWAWDKPDMAMLEFTSVPG